MGALKIMVYDSLTLLLRPSLIAFVLVVISAVANWRRSASAPPRLRSLLVAIPIWWIVSSPVVGYLALGSLEWHYPPRRDRPNEVAAIVVLGGYLRPADDWHGWPQLGSDSVERCRLTAEIYHAGQRCLVLVSGGAVGSEGSGTDEQVTTIADAMADFLVQLGVDREDLVIEADSTSTFENSVATADLLRPLAIERVVLVTDATHLLRSQACFKRQGIETVPRGTRYRATSWPSAWYAWLPSPDGAAAVDVAAHEWLGLVWYWIKGRIG